MDDIIQGQCQSAIVQKLSETEHNVKRFTYDIPDNAPIHSNQKEEITYYVGDDSATGIVRFRVPRRGYLNRMWLKVRTEQTFKQDYIAEKGRGCETFAHFFVSASLFIGGKRVETLYPESVMYNATTHSSAASQHVMRGLTGIRSDDASVPMGFDFGKPHNFTVGDKATGNADFIIPLEFSMFKYFKDSLDTNFIAPVEVEFEKKQVIRFQQPTDKTFSTLVCKYHNFMNHFRTNVRNANFPRETTSYLLTTARLLDETPIRKDLFIDGTTAATPPGNQIKSASYTFKVNDFKDVSDMLISFTRPALETLDYQGEFQTGYGFAEYVRVTLKANGRTILDKYHHELVKPNFNIPSQYMPDMVKPEKLLMDFGDPDLFEGNLGVPGGTSYFLSKNYFDAHRPGPPLLIVPLKMFATDEFYSGALNMKSLTNVEITVESNSFIDNLDIPEDHEGMIPRIVLLSKSIARLDTKTGIVSV